MKLLEIMGPVISETNLHQYLNGLENGFFNPAQEKLASLAKIYEVEITDLYTKRFAPADVEFDDLKRANSNLRVNIRRNTFNLLEKQQRKAAEDSKKIIEIKQLFYKTPEIKNKIDTISGVEPIDFGASIVPEPKSPLYGFIYPTDMYYKNKSNNDENI
jgi:transcriptional regulator with XRE-family HTH domain